MALLTLDARLGIGTIRSVLNALKDGDSMLKVFVLPLMTTVNNSVPMVFVFNVSKDILLKMESVLLIQLTKVDLLILAVKLGTGTTKSVSNVHKDGDSMPKEYVLPKTITVEFLITKVYVMNASKDIFLKMEDVSLTLKTRMDLPISAVKLGTGITKSVLNAQLDSFLILLETAYQLMISAENTIAMVLVFLVTKDST